MEGRRRCGAFCLLIAPRGTLPAQVLLRGRETKGPIQPEEGSFPAGVRNPEYALLLSSLSINLRLGDCPFAKLVLVRQ